MSYGAFAKQAARYREAEVLSASPAQLVVIVYEHLLTNLRRARLLGGATEIAARSDALERARAALTELMVTLDHERGGDVAARLASLYGFMLGELTTLGVKPSPDRLDRLVALVSELRDAFAQAGQAAPVAAAV
jgi:flagellar secretion chaperone FliS